MFEVSGMMEHEVRAAASNEVTEKHIEEGVSIEDNGKGKRGWFFTWNNWKPENLEKLKSWFEGNGGKWYVVGKEHAPTTGTPHLQGAVYFKSAKTRSAITKGVGTGGRWFGMRGTCQQCLDYCTKEDKDAAVWGEMPQQGERTDLNKLRDRIVAGEKVDDIILAEPVVGYKYGRPAREMETIVRRQAWRKWKTELIWYWGPTGTGKSWHCFQGYSPETHYLKNGSDKWWGGYSGQDIVVINDFRGAIEFDELLRLNDHWPHNVSVKFQEDRPFVSKKILISSSLHPEEVYRNRAANDKLVQFCRRAEIVHLTECMDKEWLKRCETETNLMLLSNSTEVPRVIVDLGTSEPPFIDMKVCREIEFLAKKLSEEERKWIAMKIMNMVD